MHSVRGGPAPPAARVTTTPWSLYNSTQSLSAIPASAASRSFIQSGSIPPGGGGHPPLVEEGGGARGAEPLDVEAVRGVCPPFVRDPRPAGGGKQAPRLTRELLEGEPHFPDPFRQVGEGQSHLLLLRLERPVRGLPVRLGGEVEDEIRRVDRLLYGRGRSPVLFRRGAPLRRFVVEVPVR